MITAAFRIRAMVERITDAPLVAWLVGLDLLQLGHRLLEPLGGLRRISALPRGIEGRVELEGLVPVGDRRVDLALGVGVQAAKI